MRNGLLRGRLTCERRFSTRGGVPACVLVESDQLCIQRSLKGGTSRVPAHVGFERWKGRQSARRIDVAQDEGHEKIGDGETIADKKGALSESGGEVRQFESQKVACLRPDPLGPTCTDLAD